MRYLFGKALNRYLARAILEKSIQYPVKHRKGPERNEPYKAWVRTLPCCCGCGRGPSEAAHTGSDGGQSQKASDFTCVPLYWECHREYHQIGKRAFEIKHQVSFAQLVRGLNARYFGSVDSAARRT
jgi:hypothetical protein